MNQRESEIVFDTVVVGGGVIGLSVAYELLLRDRSVLVVDQERPGSGASHVAGGMLAPVSEAEDQPDVLTEFCLAAARMYPEFVSGLERVAQRSVRYRSEGTLWVALNRDDEQELERQEETLHERDLEARRVSAKEIAALEPHLSPRVLRGLIVEGDRSVDPRALLLALQLAVRSLGGKFLCPARAVELVEREGRAVGVVTVDSQQRRQVVSAEHIVLAAGAWSAKGPTVDGAALPVRPVKGQLVRLRGTPLIRHVTRSPDVYLIPRDDGELLLGATVEEMGFDVSPQAGAVMDLLRHAWDVLPGIYDLEFAGVDVGLRPTTDDHLPLIGPTATAGVLVATGHYRNGILLGPLTGRAIAASIVGDPVEDCLRPFVPTPSTAAGGVT